MSELIERNVKKLKKVASLNELFCLFVCGTVSFVLHFWVVITSVHTGWTNYSPSGLQQLQ